MSWFKGVLIVAVLVWFFSVAVVADTVFVARWESGDQHELVSGIYRVDSTIQGLIPIVFGLDHPYLGVCGSDGYLYFAERGKQRIIRVTQDGQEITQIFRTLGNGPYDAPEGPSFDGQGNLYWTNTGIRRSLATG